MKKLFILVLISLILSVSVSSAVHTEKVNDEKTHLTMADTKEIGEFTHTPIIEYATATTCPYCPAASEQLYSIYSQGNYDFYFVSLVSDKNWRASRRLQELGVRSVPDAYFDGSYKHVVGQQSDEQAYIDALTQTGTREVAEVELSANVIWEGNGVLDIRVNVDVNTTDYQGHLRAYVVEPVSRWDDFDGNPYHFGVLGFAFDKDLAVSQHKQTGPDDTYEFTTTWRGSLLGFGDITKDNIMVIITVSNQETGFVDETTAVTPEQKEEVITNGYTNITAEEAWNFVKGTCNGIQRLIDVRTIGEYINERISTPSLPEKPRLFPVQLLEKEGLFLRLFNLLYGDEEVILYCRTARRSAIAAQLLVDNEFSGTVYNMIGGITAWKEAGLPTVEGIFPS